MNVGLDLTNKSLDAEILSVASVGSDLNRDTYYKAVLHAETDMFITHITTVDINRDFNNGRTDKVTIIFMMPLGDFVYHVLPHKNNLIMTLENFNIGMHTKEDMRATIVTMDESISSGKLQNDTMENLNKHLTKVEMQLTSLTYLSMRGKMVEGVFKEATVEDVLISEIGSGINKFSSLFGLSSGGLDIVPPDNTRKYDHIIIPHHKNVSLLDLPKYLQTSEYGVYNGDIGFYLQAYNNIDKMHIYPLYRNNLLSFRQDKLYVISVASAVMAGIDNTYAMDGNLLKILVLAGEKPMDGEDKFHSMGTSVNAIESDSIATRQFEISKDGMKISADNMLRRQTHKALESKDYTVKNSEITNNMYKHRSEILKGDGVLVNVTWNTSNSRLITPMMPVIFIEEVGGKISKREGMVQAVYVLADNVQKRETTSLTLFLENGTTKDKNKQEFGSILSELF